MTRTIPRFEVMDVVARSQLEDLPQGFVLNPLDLGNVKTSHGFTEKCFNLLIFIR